MPRTIDHIVACHQHATLLRDAGRPIWANSINLHGILANARGKTSAPEIAEVAHLLAAEIRRLPKRYFDPAGDDYDYDFLNAIEELEAMSAESLLRDCEDSDDQPADVLDGWLSEIYDWCDAHRVWTRG